MWLWWWYVFAAALLGVAGYIVPSLGWMLLLAAAVHASRPLPPKILVALSAGLATAALALLWSESHLPPVKTAVKFLLDPRTRPSAAYLAEFAWQALSIPMLAAAAALGFAARRAHREAPFLLGAAAYAAFGVAAWRAPQRAAVADFGGPVEPAEEAASLLAGGVARSTGTLAAADAFYLARGGVAEPRESESGDPETVRSPEDFYARERGRIVSYPRPSETAKPFDLLILHVCSLSWKDLKDSGADLRAFFSTFDYVFTSFNSAASYSGPSALRVLRAPCGQLPHRRLYYDAPPGCYWLDALRASGFRTFTMFTHNGKFDGFAEKAARLGHADPPLAIDGLPESYLFFDGKPMVRDDAALHRFWEAREASKAPRAALYFNTANLHAGTHKRSERLSPDTPEAYRRRLDALVAELKTAIAEVERSGRNAVVILVPEHGAALTGNPMQPKDVRDIPLPSIATVPAAVKLLGKRVKERAGGPTVVAKPTSLLALAWLVAEFLRRDPFGPDARAPEAIAGELPLTPFLAEEENAAVIRLAEGYVYRYKGAEWRPLPDFATLPPGTVPTAAELSAAAGR
ncbi:MAG: cellulose biosynthesis protein BcsG [Elusimicrobia bacterium]|nr:cellulose biosynthesis protein BcsG [Elusimicrobiota bacterium]